MTVYNPNSAFELIEADEEALREEAALGSSEVVAEDVAPAYYITVMARSGSGQLVSASSGAVTVDSTPPVFFDKARATCQARESSDFDSPEDARALAETGTLPCGVAPVHYDPSWRDPELGIVYRLQVTHQASNTSIAAFWQAVDAGSGIAHYEWRIDRNQTEAQASVLERRQVLAAELRSGCNGTVLASSSDTEEQRRLAQSLFIPFSCVNGTVLALVQSLEDPQQAVVDGNALAVLPWTNVGLETERIATGLSLLDGASYCVTVRATNNAGLQTQASAPCVTVSTTPPQAADDDVSVQGTKSVSLGGGTPGARRSSASGASVTLLFGAQPALETTIGGFHDPKSVAEIDVGLSTLPVDLLNNVTAGFLPTPDVLPFFAVSVGGPSAALKIRGPNITFYATLPDGTVDASQPSIVRSLAYALNARENYSLALEPGRQYFFVTRLSTVSHAFSLVQQGPIVYVGPRERALGLVLCDATAVTNGRDAAPLPLYDASQPVSLFNDSGLARAEAASWVRDVAVMPLTIAGSGDSCGQHAVAVGTIARPTVDRSPVPAVTKSFSPYIMDVSHALKGKAPLARDVQGRLVADAGLTFYVSPVGREPLAFQPLTVNVSVNTADVNMTTTTPLLLFWDVEADGGAGMWRDASHVCYDRFDAGVVDDALREGAAWVALPVCGRRAVNGRTQSIALGQETAFALVLASRAAVNTPPQTTREVRLTTRINKAIEDVQLTASDDEGDALAFAVGASAAAALAAMGHDVRLSPTGQLSVWPRPFFTGTIYFSAIVQEVAGDDADNGRALSTTFQINVTVTAETLAPFLTPVRPGTVSPTFKRQAYAAHRDMAPAPPVQLLFVDFTGANVSELSVVYGPKSAMSLSALQPKPGIDQVTFMRSFAQAQCARLSAGAGSTLCPYPWRQLASRPRLPSSGLSFFTLEASGIIADAELLPLVNTGDGPLGPDETLHVVDVACPLYQFQDQARPSLCVNYTVCAENEITTGGMLTHDVTCLTSATAAKGPLSPSALAATVVICLALLLAGVFITYRRRQSRQQRLKAHKDMVAAFGPAALAMKSLGSEEQVGEGGPLDSKARWLFRPYTCQEAEILLKMHGAATGCFVVTQSAEVPTDTAVLSVKCSDGTVCHRQVGWDKRKRALVLDSIPVPGAPPTLNDLVGCLSDPKLNDFRLDNRLGPRPHVQLTSGLCRSLFYDHLVWLQDTTTLANGERMLRHCEHAPGAWLLRHVGLPGEHEYELLLKQTPTEVTKYAVSIDEENAMTTIGGALLQRADGTLPCTFDAVLEALVEPSTTPLPLVLGQPLLCPQRAAPEKLCHDATIRPGWLQPPMSQHLAFEALTSLNKPGASVLAADLHRSDRFHLFYLPREGTVDASEGRRLGSGSRPRHALLTLAASGCWELNGIGCPEAMTTVEDVIRALQQPVPALEWRSPLEGPPVALPLRLVWVERAAHVVATKAQEGDSDALPNAIHETAVDSDLIYADFDEDDAYLSISPSEEMEVTPAVEAGLARAVETSQVEAKVMPQAEAHTTVPLQWGYAVLGQPLSEVCGGAVDADTGVRRQLQLGARTLRRTKRSRHAIAPVSPPRPAEHDAGRGHEDSDYSVILEDEDELVDVEASVARTIAHAPFTAFPAFGSGGERLSGLFLGGRKRGKGGGSLRSNAFVVLLGLMLICAPAAAARRGESTAPTSVDTIQGDLRLALVGIGALASSRFQGNLQRLFYAHDFDGSGTWSAEEVEDLLAYAHVGVEAVRPRLAAGLMHSLDVHAPHDGKVDASEMLEAMSAAGWEQQSADGASCDAPGGFCPRLTVAVEDGGAQDACCEAWEAAFPRLRAPASHSEISADSAPTTPIAPLDNGTLPDDPGCDFEAFERCGASGLLTCQQCDVLARCQIDQSATVFHSPHMYGDPAIIATPFLEAMAALEEYAATCRVLLRVTGSYNLAIREDRAHGNYSDAQTQADRAHAVVFDVKHSRGFCESECVARAAADVDSLAPADLSCFMKRVVSNSNITLNNAGGWLIPAPRSFQSADPMQDMRTRLALRFGCTASAYGGVGGDATNVVGLPVVPHTTASLYDGQRRQRAAWNAPEDCAWAADAGCTGATALCHTQALSNAGAEGPPSAQDLSAVAWLRGAAACVVHAAVPERERERDRGAALSPCNLAPATVLNMFMPDCAANAGLCLLSVKELRAAAALLTDGSVLVEALASFCGVARRCPQSDETVVQDALDDICRHVNQTVEAAAAPPVSRDSATVVPYSTGVLLPPAKWVPAGPTALDEYHEPEAGSPFAADSTPLLDVNAAPAGADTLLAPGVRLWDVLSRHDGILPALRVKGQGSGPGPVRNRFVRAHPDVVACVSALRDVLPTEPVEIVRFYETQTEASARGDPHSVYRSGAAVALAPGHGGTPAQLLQLAEAAADACLPLAKRRPRRGLGLGLGARYLEVVFIRLAGPSAPALRGWTLGDTGAAGQGAPLPAADFDALLRGFEARTSRRLPGTEGCSSPVTATEACALPARQTPHFDNGFLRQTEPAVNSASDFCTRSKGARAEGFLAALSDVERLYVDTEPSDGLRPLSDVRAALRACYASCDEGIMFGGDVSARAASKVVACDALVHWLPVSVAPARDTCHLHTLNNARMRESACFWGQCLSRQPLYALLSGHFRRYFSAPVQSQSGSGPKTLNPAPLFDEARNPTPVFALLARTHAMACRGRVTVWAESAADLLKQADTLRAAMVYNPHVTHVDVRTLDRRIVEVVSALENMILEWRRRICPARGARRHVATYTVAGLSDASLGV
jgi:hypothetical protein